jgi:DNA-binding GntR family transcriptional regulator
MSLPDNNGSRPLYARVRERLIERIRSGEWKPGQLIANEFEIAAEFGVSQGTARKAIGDLASEGLVVRRQGRGTFVVEHTPAHVLFRFFNLFDADGVAVVPDSRDAGSSLAPASSEEREALGLDAGAQVIRITRIRTRDGAPFIAETITLPEALFPEGLRRAGHAHGRPPLRRRRRYANGGGPRHRAGHAPAANRPHRLRTRRQAGGMARQPVPPAGCALPRAQPVECATH